jgi:hypothetical protein
MMLPPPDGSAPPRAAMRLATALAMNHAPFKFVSMTARQSLAVCSKGGVDHALIRHIQTHRLGLSAGAIDLANQIGQSVLPPRCHLRASIGKHPRSMPLMPLEAPVTNTHRPVKSNWSARSF